MSEHWTEDVFVEAADLFATDLEDRIEAARNEVERLLDVLERTYDVRPETALDVACGIGRHTVALADRGVETVGVDLSEPFLERARELARERGVTARTDFYREDMRRLTGFDGRYDLLVNAYTSFGFFDDRTNRAVLEAMYERTAPGGTLAMELANKDGILTDFRPESVGTNGGLRYAEAREYEPRHSRMATERWVYDADSDEFEGHYEYDLRLYSPAELAGCFERAGFEDVHVFGSFDGEDLARESTRMLVLGRRP